MLDARRVARAFDRPAVIAVRNANCSQADLFSSYAALTAPKIAGVAPGLPRSVDSTAPRNLRRRHLTVAQRVTLAKKLLVEAEKQAKERQIKKTGESVTARGR